MTVVVKQINNIPLAVPGQGMAEVVRRAAQWMKSNPIAYTESSGAINLIELPGNTVVTKALMHITTAFDASGTGAAATGTITIPNDSGTETIWDSLITKLQSSGFSPSTVDAVIVPSSGGMVIFNYTTSTSGVSTNTKGSFEVYLEYVQLEDML